MKTYDELYSDNLKLLEPVECNVRDREYICLLMTQKDSMAQMYAKHYADELTKGMETLKVVVES